MTIERLGQLTAETRVLTDFSYHAQKPVIASDFAKTGIYSYEYGWNTGAIGFPVAAQTAVRMGYWLYLVGAGMVDDMILYKAGNGAGVGTGTDQIRIEVNVGTGQMEVKRPDGGTSNAFEVLFSAPLSPQFFTTGTWFHVGITHKIHATEGFLSVYVDGIRILEYVGNTLSSFWNGSSISFSTSSTRFMSAGALSTSALNGFDDARLDDLYLDSYTDELDSPVPSRRFLMVLPTAAGADAAWTPVPVVANYLNVDDNPNDGDATYNKALAVDLRDTFVCGDITLPADHRIVAVLPSPFAKRLDSEILHELSVHAWDGLQYGDSADLDLNMSYDVPVFGRFTTQPDGSAWNETDFNAMQFGYRSRGVF